MDQKNGKQWIDNIYDKTKTVRSTMLFDFVCVLNDFQMPLYQK